MLPDSLLAEIDKPNTKFFIFDSKSDHQVYGDIDFQEYHWDKSKFNKVNVGDFFIYRRPQKASEVRNQFYLYGFGRIVKINDTAGSSEKKRNKPAIGIIDLGYRFIDPILQSDLDNFEWKFKERGSTWEHFFQQYGMNEITATDFINLLSIGLKNDESFDIDFQSDLDESNKDYSADDKRALRKIRGNDHRKFAQQVKLNYQRTCAISGIQIADFLVASHIIPWSKNEENRKNPANGICLSSLLDKAFDRGYLTINSNFQVVVSNKSIIDPALFDYLKQYEGKKIQLPKNSKPDLKFLAWHETHVFLKA
ncbi:HNH endonuclease [Acinetobacter sichuanensis]|uniref:HNH endonuclease n=1 Tax=Acinetobacter sichuanensis TaxID=2136183 RepID=UPI00280E5728|nr:HNH endonuclease [Acinetobacter sichuanensis]MDQ9023350.1 HNH endonuclease [Acinetobacter sichuanensis]